MSAMPMTRSRRTRRGRLLALSLPLAIGLAGCGPDEQAQLGLRKFDQKIVFGAQRTATPAPQPLPQAPLLPLLPLPNNVNPVPDFPTIVQPPLPRVPMPPTAPPPACPSADPLSVPALATTPRIDSLPAVASYEFRNEGKTTTAGGTVTSRQTSTRTVANSHRVTEVDGSVIGVFDVTDDLGGDKVTTSYKIVPKAGGIEEQAGLLITSVVKVNKDGTTDSFSPVPAIVLAPFPLQAQTTWQSAGTDPLSQSSIELQGSVGKPVRVDACGSLVEAWPLSINGVIATPQSGGQANFTATVDLASQYGGIAVADTFTRTMPGTGSLLGSNTATIDAVPARAKG
jgi:hypothetical protein